MIGVIVIGLILDLDSTVRISVVEFVLKVVLGRPFQCWEGNARRAIPSLLSIFHPQFTPYALKQSHVCKTPRDIESVQRHQRVPSWSNLPSSDFGILKGPQSWQHSDVS